MEANIDTGATTPGKSTVCGDKSGQLYHECRKGGVATQTNCEPGHRSNSGPTESGQVCKKVDGEKVAESGQVCKKVDGEKVAGTESTPAATTPEVTMPGLPNPQADSPSQLADGGPVPIPIDWSFLDYPTVGFVSPLSLTCDDEDDGWDAFLHDRDERKRLQYDDSNEMLIFAKF
ncbi:hypothetical protein GGX14DRAFT_561668 [Mycena pura]|uniref:Uncharacterized protein n=1 Tax=Mycena pura TaxID=153505 RepID=A0AAD6YH82_9AGAR|nr:hypothetical protein GGX14DRAFT_561668 [Mycena pura]